MDVISMLFEVFPIANAMIRKSSLPDFFASKLQTETA